MKLNEGQLDLTEERLQRIEVALQKQADLKSELEELESTVKDLQSKLEELPKEVDDLRGELADAESRIDDLENGDWTLTLR